MYKISTSNDGNISSQMKRQFRSLLSDIGFGVGHGGEANSHNLSLVKAVLAAGLFPNVIIAPRDLGGKSVGDATFRSLKGDVNVHPCSLTFRDTELYR